VSLSARDRKIVLALIPLALAAAYWFLLLSPKREEQAKERNALTVADTARASAAQRLAQLTAAKRSFAGDFQTVISLGKSIPASLDMPSLLVQLNTAAQGTGIDFTSVHAGDRATSPGGASSPGKPAGATTTASSSGIPGLDSIPLTFEFDGDYFQLANFLHSMKRFVQVANDQIMVRGRLMTIDSFSFKTQQANNAAPSASVPLVATVQATVYLAPKAQGLFAGATLQGPASATTNVPASSAPPASATPTTPAATVIP
jgi:hypothetical protein